MVRRLRRGGRTAVGAIAACVGLAVMAATVGATDTDVEADLNEDSVADRRWTSTEGGSGWGETRTCAVDGLSGHTACRVTAFTAYSQFAGISLEMEPSVGNQALPLLPPISCRMLNPVEPEQGALEELSNFMPFEGEAVVSPQWRVGPPVPQSNVCMSVEEAAAYEGGLAWDDSGGALASAADWTVLYSASPPLNSRTDADRSGGPTLVDNTAQLSLFQSGHALAVYHRGTDRHFWLLNFSDGSRDGFKVDRWTRIGAARFTADRLIEVEVHGVQGVGVLRLRYATDASEL